MEYQTPIFCDIKNFGNAFFKYVYYFYNINICVFFFYG